MNRQLIVHRDIPVPPRLPAGRPPHSEFRRVLVQMEIGDCVDVPIGMHRNVSIRQIAGRAGVRVRIRLVTGENNGADVWRVWKLRNVAPVPTKRLSKAQKAHKSEYHRSWRKRRK